MPTPTPQLVGYVAMAFTIFIWASFALTASITKASALSFADVAMLRAAIPAMVFILWLPSRWSMIKAAGWTSCILVSFSAGVPFFALVVEGGGATSAAHVAAVIAGTVPIIVTGWIWTVQGERPTLLKIIGLLILISGVGLMLFAQSEAAITDLYGVFILILAGLCWGTYTFFLKQSGLDPIAALLLIAVPSFLALVFLLGTGALTSNLGQFTLGEALPFILIQGFGVGIVSNMTFTLAIQNIGPARAVTIGSLTPAVTAVLAVPFLGEALGGVVGVAVVVVCLGVWVANRG